MQTHKKFAVDGTWKNLLADRPELEGKELILQAVSSGSIAFIFGDFDPDGEDARDYAGLTLANGDDVTVNAGTTAVWVRAGSHLKATVAIHAL